MKKKINKKERKEIFEVLSSVHFTAEELLKGSLEEAADNILAIEKRLRTEDNYVINHPDRYIRFDISLDSNYYDEYKYYTDVTIQGVRLEDDKEYNMRMEDIRKREIAAQYAKKKAAEKRLLLQKEKAKRKEKEDFKMFQKIKNQYGW